MQHISNLIEKHNGSYNKPIDHVSEEKTTQMRISHIIRPLLAESACAIALNLGALMFFSTPISIPILTVSVITSLGLSCLFAQMDIVHQQQNISNKTASILRGNQLLSKSSIVYTLGLSGPNIVIHEYGHFALAKLLFNKSKARMWISPFQGGSTSYTASSNLTSLGKFFGKSGSMTAVAAAGLAASTVYICAELAMAHKIQKTHPKASLYMKLHAISYLFQEVIYSFMVFAASKKDLGHDLVRLWSVSKIHPAIPITLLIALPIIQMFRLHSRQN